MNETTKAQSTRRRELDGSNTFTLNFVSFVSSWFRYLFASLCVSVSLWFYLKE